MGTFIFILGKYILPILITVFSITDIGLTLVERRGHYMWHLFVDMLALLSGTLALISLI